MSSSRTKQAKNAGREWFAPAHAWEFVYQIGEQESIEVSILCICMYMQRSGLFSLVSSDWF